MFSDHPYFFSWFIFPLFSQSLQEVYVRADYEHIYVQRCFAFVLSQVEAVFRPMPGNYCLSRLQQNTYTSYLFTIRYTVVFGCLRGNSYREKMLYIDLSWFVKVGGNIVTQKQFYRPHFLSHGSLIQLCIEC